jgi:predicted amidohydrolase
MFLFVLITFLCAQNVLADPNLVAQWEFDDASGTSAVDATGNGHTAALVGTPDWVTDTERGSCLDFNGIADYVTHDFNLPRDEGTLTHWVKADQLKSMIPYYEGDGTTNAHNGFSGTDILEIHTGLYDSTADSWYSFFQDGTAQSSCVTAGTPVTDQWVHIAMSWNTSGYMKMYINGTQIGSSIDMTTESFEGRDATVHFIGRPGDASAGRHWDGCIDDVRIYDRQITDIEIEEIYKDEQPDADMVAWYKLNQDSGSTADDSSSSSNDGTIYGDPEWTYDADHAWCLSCDGDGDYIDCPYGYGINPSTQPITLSMWVKRVDSTTGQILFSSGQTTGDRCYISIDQAGKWAMGIQDSTWGTGGITSAEYDWTHLALVMDGSDAILYVNGQYDHKKTYTSFTLYSNFDIARHPTSPGTWDANCLIDDVRIYDRALTYPEIVDLVLPSVQYEEDYTYIGVVSPRFNPPEQYDDADEERTLPAVYARISQAAAQGVDLLVFPAECIKSPGEPIPGPISNAIAEKADVYDMYIIANICEVNDSNLYLTSFLCDPDGDIVGKYRKSHQMPDEDWDLGDELPVFETDLGKIAMRIGTDRYFVDIDHVYSSKGAQIVCCSQYPEPVEDEYAQDAPLKGRARDYDLYYAVARYSNGKSGYICNKYTPYCGMPTGRAYVLNDEGEKIACTARTGGGVACAAILNSSFATAGGVGKDNRSMYDAMFDPNYTDPNYLDRPTYAYREVKVGAISDHLSPSAFIDALDDAEAADCNMVVSYETCWVDRVDYNGFDTFASISQKADDYDMYVLLTGVNNDVNINLNEGILWDPNGDVVWVYTKIAMGQRHIPGTETPVFDTDFGRIACRICADENYEQLDRAYFVKGAEILFIGTQSWGPEGISRYHRDYARAMDTCMFHVESTHRQSEYVHRSQIVDPAGMPLAQMRYQKYGDLVTTTIDLDNDRPKRYIRQWTAYTPAGYLEQYQPDYMPSYANDLADTIRSQRRPSLYSELAPD